MLAFNFAYIGWLSPWGLLMALIITVVGVSVHFRQERRDFLFNLGNQGVITLHPANPHLHGIRQARVK